jgi:glycine dehydrogenase
MAVNLKHHDEFPDRHIGPDADDTRAMLETLGLKSLEALSDETVPRSIRLDRPLRLPAARSEREALAALAALAAQNRVNRTFLGMGYADCITPPVILRNIVENPGWYTAYTPYQAEISQGRLEALLNYQTMVLDLTGLEVANASLLDEATAAAEAMTMLFAVADHDAARPFFVSAHCHPQSIAVVSTRAEALGIEVVVGDHQTIAWDRRYFGALLQYPASDGLIADYQGFCTAAHGAGALVAVGTDLLALALLTPPGAFGADVAFGNSQRFGVPLGYGGPHAAFFATRNDLVRKMPGRIIGVSEDADGNRALRMALQTREQHIRREKATSNICTAQVLLAVVAGMYAVYHGPKGIRAIAERVHGLAATLALGLERLGIPVRHRAFFDTLAIDGTPAELDRWFLRAAERGMDLRRIEPTSVGISLDETKTEADVDDLLAVFGSGPEAAQAAPPARARDLALEVDPAIPAGLRRTSPYLTHPVFSLHHSETEMLRYMKGLENRDFSLTHGMIPLGSCTMKLNATSEMIPVTWPEFNRIHPFAPVAATAGYRQLFEELESWLGEITGFAGVSLQPNAGSQGEYAGLLVIRRYHQSRGEAKRDVCLIPASAHGTNPASAVMAGFRVVVVECEANGNVDLADLERKASEHGDRLAALMVTYPSTYGVFEEEIRKICGIIHARGGQVYMDGANMNAQVGLCRPGDIGADVCHLNLHKTFCIPHGGGGPGMGPIGVAAHLTRFLPRHPLVATGGEDGIGAVSAGPWGSPSILPISWTYIARMGPDGLTRATEVAILNANYVAERLGPHYPVLYRGVHGRVAHECILDLRPLKQSAGIEAEDVAKRLMDYGFHAPTLSFPVAGTLMIEPTESESKAELDRFCAAMIAIREEIREIERGLMPKDSNPLKHAPHTAQVIAASEWKRPYPRERGAFPNAETRARKFWPAVGRVNNVLGDRKLVCSCPPVDDYR